LHRDAVEGASAVGVIEPEGAISLVAAERGSAPVIGIGFQEDFIASDLFGLLPVANECMLLDEGDIAELRLDAVTIRDRDAQMVTAPGTQKGCRNEVNASVEKIDTTCKRRS
jgi:Glucosamine 6-phosphate synthetase, contains amidotransferase and phosphosugar isomerase domains